MLLHKLLLAAAVAALAGASSMAQEPEVPLTWKGSGEANFYTMEGESEIDFDLEFHVDEEGMVTGKTSNEDGSTVLEKFYYGEEVSAKSPALKSRRLVLVLKLQSSDEPWLIILNGTVLGGKYFHGELRITSQDAEGMKDALNLGDKMAVEMASNSLPSGLKKAIDKSAPMGFFEVEGKIVTDK